MSDVNVSFDKQSMALIRELKSSLYEIARRAELGKHSANAIQLQAELSLKLIDSYILSAMSEHGQLALEMQPLALGSVMHEAAHETRKTSQATEIVVEAHALSPVMTHRTALSGFLAMASNVLEEIRQNSGAGKLVFRSYSERSGKIGVGVFIENDSLSAVDLRAALLLSGSSQMALSRHSAGSGVMLSVADTLASALGGCMQVKRMGNLRGFATCLPKSTQLSLV